MFCTRFSLPTVTALLFLFLLPCPHRTTASSILPDNLVHWLDERANHSDLVRFSVTDLTVIVDEAHPFEILVTGRVEKALTLTFNYQHAGLVHVQPPQLVIQPNLEENKTVTYPVHIVGESPGSLLVTANTTPTGVVDDKDLYIRVRVALSLIVIYLSLTIGWVYFVAWSISFYPQIYENYSRKSVIGLSFDFLSLNLMGHTLYAVFNIGLYWIPAIEAEYFSRYPRGLNPVMLNDVVFSIHATIVTLFTIGQCFVYERGQQRVSYVARGILSIFALIIIVTVILAGLSVMNWLDFLYACSYIKLAITLIKYVPQAVLNYRRKSTLGWSIGNILLDFTGGMLSMLQMILNAYNFDDWASIFGDPTKFGLGLFSVCFDILFIIQHYWLYSNKQKTVSDDGKIRSLVITEVK